MDETVSGCLDAKSLTFDRQKTLSRLLLSGSFTAVNF